MPYFCLIESYWFILRALIIFFLLMLLITNWKDRFWGIYLSRLWDIIFLKNYIRYWPSPSPSDWIKSKNSSNSIFPEWSSSTESISFFTSYLVSANPTDISNSSNSSIPILPLFFLSNALKYYFISLLSFSSKLIKNFLPWFPNHFLSPISMRNL